MMRVLIGLPLNEEDYPLSHKWIENIAETRKHYLLNTDLLFVDSSTNLEYIDKIKKLCKTYKLSNYKIQHINISKFQPKGEKIGLSYEVIRKAVLAGKYDSWLAWKNNLLVPYETLQKFTQIMTATQSVVIHLNYASPILVNFDPYFSFTLIARKALETVKFSTKFPNFPDDWSQLEAWFKELVIKNNINGYLEVYGTTDKDYLGTGTEFVIPQISGTNIFALSMEASHFDSTWLGIPAVKNPADAWLYQEIIYKTKPNFILECGSFKGGGTLFLASMLDICRIDGRVYSIEIKNEKDLPTHPKINWIHGDSTDSKIIKKIVKAAKGKRCLVILDSNHTKEHVLKEIESYASIVSPGSYLVVEDTWYHSGKGGPYDAVEEFLKQNINFKIDRDIHRYQTTNNPNGFLRRVK